MDIKTQLKNRAPGLAALYRSVRYREISPPFRRRFALGLLHDEIKRLVGGHRGGYYIEAGALDGLYQSNTAYLERYLGWTGILIEPLPHRMLECRRNRRRSHVVNCGLVAFDYGRHEIELHDRDAMTFVTGDSAGDSPLRAADIRGADGKRVIAPARTLDAVLGAFGYPVVDLFSLDVEGAELEVLRGIDFEKADIRNFVIETSHVPDVAALLRPHGFSLVRQMTFHDYHFARDIGVRRDDAE